MNLTYFDKEGNQVDLNEFCRLMGDLEYVRIGQNRFEDGSMLSTVWLGLSGEGKPVFETVLIQAGTEGIIDILGRWDTLETAEKMHKRLYWEHYNKD